jgi:hypothetical protein
LLFVSHSLRQERSDKLDQDLLSPRLTNHRNEAESLWFLSD